MVDWLVNYGERRLLCVCFLGIHFVQGIRFAPKGFLVFFPAGSANTYLVFYGLKHDNRKPGEFFTRPGCQENYTATSPGFSDGPFDADLEVVFNLFNFTPKKKSSQQRFEKNVGFPKHFC